MRLKNPLFTSSAFNSVVDMNECIKFTCFTIFDLNCKYESDSDTCYYNKILTRTEEKTLTLRTKHRLLRYTYIVATN